MNAIKCKSCGLTNFPTDVECRRCGFSFVRAEARKSEKPPRQFSFGPLIILALAAAAVYYFYIGVEASVDQVNRNEAKRVASQPDVPAPSPKLSRSESDKQRSGHYGTAVRGSQSLKDHTKRTQDTEKAIQQISNSR